MDRGLNVTGHCSINGLFPMLLGGGGGGGDVSTLNKGGNQRTI